MLFLVQGELIESSSDEDESGLQDEKQSGSVLDMEDLGNIMNRLHQKKVCLTYRYKKKHFQLCIPIFSQDIFINILCCLACFS